MGQVNTPSQAFETIEPPNADKALEWITALAADAIPYRLLKVGEEWQIQVPLHFGEKARGTIHDYEEVNIGWPPQPQRWVESKALAHPLWSGLWGAAFIIMVFFCFGAYDGNNPHLRSGASDSVAIKEGQWWRPVTALTLHSGFEHLAGNAVFLTILGGVVCRNLGVGLGWTLIVLSGIAGNTLVAFASRDNPHLSVGASTACFGALGIAAMFQALENYRHFGGWKSVWSRAWIPLCGGMALLGFAGTHPGSDIAAHAAGFFCGLLVVLPFSIPRPRQCSEWVEAALKVGTVVLIMFAWRAAIQVAQQ